MFTDIAHSGSPEQGVCDGMADNVGIRVAEQALGMLDPEPARGSAAGRH